MRLYLLRHAEAEPGSPTLPDPDRPLTAEGRAQAERVAEFCTVRGLRPDTLLTSPFRRARETAEPVSRACQVPVVTELFLRSGMDPNSAVQELRAYRQQGAVMLVGHQPDLGVLAAFLIGVYDEGNLVVGKAALLTLEVDSFRSRGARLRSVVPVELM